MEGDNPWSDDWSEPKCEQLNLTQLNLGDRMPMHPHTCGERSRDTHGTEGGDLGVLIATPKGWVCPHCEYRQALYFAPCALPPRASSPVPSDYAHLFGLSSTESVLNAVDKRLAGYEALRATLTAGSEPLAAVELMIAVLGRKRAQLQPPTSPVTGE